MFGLFAILSVAALLIVIYAIFTWLSRRYFPQKKLGVPAPRWAVGMALLVLLLTWDTLPTWLAFTYYSNREAGVTVYKTLEQWKAEHPDEAARLKPRAKGSQPSKRNLGGGMTLTEMNERLGYTSQRFDKLTSNVYAHRFEIIDMPTNEVLLRYVQIGAGNGGGLATGGDGWWAFWLVHGPTYKDFEVFSNFRKSAENLGQEQ